MVSPTHKIGVLSDGELQFQLPAATTLIHDFQVPATGRYSLLRHDWQCSHFDYKSRTAGTNPDSPNAALPETVHLNPFDGQDFMEMPQYLEEFQLALMAKADPTLGRAQLLEKWRALTVNSVAFTDKHAIDTGTRFFGGDPSKNYKDEMLGINLYNPKCIAWKVAITCAGNVVKHIDTLTIEAVDPKNLPGVDYVWERPWLCHWAVEATNQKLDLRVMVDGALRTAWRCSPFPQMRPAGTPIVLWGVGGRTRVAEKWRLLPVANGATFSPYFP